MAGFSDGSFIAIGSNVTAFDKHGRETWTVASESFTGNPEKLSHPKALAASNDEILVLEYGEPQVKCFDREGKFLRTVDVKSAKGENGVAWTISSDLDGGFIVDDTRLNANGTLRERLTPKYADGRLVDVRGVIQAAPDGTLWTTDGYCLVRLNEKAIVDRVVGQSPRLDELGHVSHVAIDPKGQIYAMDGRTGALHVFDSAGRFHHVCPCTSKDFSGLVSAPSISFGDQGDVYFGPGKEIAFLNQKCPYRSLFTEPRTP